MNRKGLAIVVLAVIVLFILFSGRKSGFGAASPAAMTISGMNLSDRFVTSGGAAQTTMIAPAPVDQMGDNIGQTVSSASLIPRDVVATEDFGQFSPDKILGNQNYLDPRSQIGYPETLGGVLRNANQDFRSEPLNPRTPVSIFNLSTIPPDVMRPRFEIDYEYQ
jgi:hypothetical protein